MLTDTETALLGVWQRWPNLSERDRRMTAYATLGLSEIRATQIVNGLVERARGVGARPGHGRSAGSAAGRENASPERVRALRRSARSEWT